jgi:ParB family chromosome partitioning protein
VDTAAVALKVKQEFAAKEKARKTAKPDTKATPKPKRAA